MKPTLVITNLTTSVRIITAKKPIEKRKKPRKAKR